MRDLDLEGHGDLPNRIGFMKVLARFRESGKVREGDEEKQKGRAIKHTFGESSHLRLIVWLRFGLTRRSLLLTNPALRRNLQIPLDGLTSHRSSSS